MRICDGREITTAAYKSRTVKMRTNHSAMLHCELQK